MAWTKPQYSKNKVDAAGDILIRVLKTEKERENALAIINNWRSSHSLPMNALQAGLRQNAKKVDGQALVAQRIKRLASIDFKLRRFPTMKLSQMQDIGGCRAIVHDVERVKGLVKYYKECGFNYALVSSKDYIADPQSSGYRGVHLIYRYCDDNHVEHNGLKIEMQIRSKLQHAWATAVETVGTFIKQALKSSRGEKDWLRFFALMGTAIALKEKTALVPSTPSNKSELVKELRTYASKLDVEKRLKLYGTALHTSRQPGLSDAYYFLLHLDPKAQVITIYGYKKGALERATKKYLEVERSLDNEHGAEAVLVSVKSLESLRRAYPNYFLDTRVFIDAVSAALME